MKLQRKERQCSWEVSGDRWAKERGTEPSSHNRNETQKKKSRNDIISDLVKKRGGKRRRSVQFSILLLVRGQKGITDDGSRNGSQRVNKEKKKGNEEEFVSRVNEVGRRQDKR